MTIIERRIMSAYLARGATFTCAAALALLLVTGCAADEPAAETLAVETSETAAPTLPGRLMFSRFDESTHTFISTHIVRADGSDEVELTLPGPEGGGRWSHSGTEIAVMTIRPDERVGTAVITPDGTVERVLDIPDPTLNLVCTDWSPDDARLACEGWDDTDSSRVGIYTVSATDGSDLQRLTTPPDGLVDFPGGYSPDGTQFAFLRSADESQGTLMIVDAPGGEPRALSDEQFEDPGRFSPDGRSLLTAGGGDITTLDLDGKVIERISEDGAFLFGAAWSPDGDWIAYSRAVSGPFADVYVSRPDGSERYQVTDTEENEIQIDWGAGG